MAATQTQIKQWFEKAQEEKATHMVIICDTFDYGDYPVNFHSEAAARRRCEQPGDMQRVMEVYKIELGWEAQSSGRVMNF